MNDMNRTINPIDQEASLWYVLKVAFPMIITFMSFTLMQFLDRYMVSFLGTDALAAILPAGVVSFLFASAALGIIKTLSTFVSQSLGKGNKQSCSNYCWHSIYIGVGYFLMVIAVMWPAAPKIFELMGHESEVAALEVVYFRIMLFSHLFAMFIWAPANFFIGIHRTKILLGAAIFGHWLNATFNYLLIFGKFGFPEMGFEGAAWGTFIGIVAEACVVMGAFMLGPTGREFKSMGSMLPDMIKVKQLLRVGVPASIGFIINISLFNLVLLALISRFGKASLAATNLVLTTVNMTIMPLVGVSNALTATVGKAIGARRLDVGIKQTKITLKAVFWYVSFMSAVFIFFKEPLVSIWSNDPAVLAVGENIFVLAAIFIFFNSMLLIITGSLRGAGDTVWLACMSGVGCFLILGAGGVAIIEYFPNLEASGPWLAAILYVFFVTGANIWRFKSRGWASIDIFKGSN